MPKEGGVALNLHQSFRKYLAYSVFGPSMCIYMCIYIYINVCEHKDVAAAFSQNSAASPWMFFQN